MAAEGAEFTVVNGWERVDYIKPTPDFHPTLGFHFDEAFDVVAGEVAAVQKSVGLCEVNGFNRIEIDGPDGHAFLDHLICGRVTKKEGKVGLGYLLNDHGCIKAEATVANLPDGLLWFGSAAAAEWHDMDWLKRNADGFDVSIRSLTNDYTILVLAGPKSRDVMHKVSRDDWSKAAFPWLSVRHAFIGIAPAVVMSVSFSGEMAYEIHIPNNQLYAAYLALRAAGEAHGLRLFGARAVDSMRMEKGFLHWKADLLTEFDPFETSLGRFVKMDKEFVGKTALEKRQVNGPTVKLVTLQVESTTTPAHPGASVMLDGKVVGTVSSGDWGHRVGMNIAYAFMKPDQAAEGTALHIDMLGALVPARVIPPAPYDPEMTLPRG